MRAAQAQTKSPVDLDALAGKIADTTDETAVADVAADPAKTDQELAASRSERYVEDITEAPVAELRVLRDRLDENMRALQQHAVAIKKGIRGQEERARRTIKFTTIARDALDMMGNEDGLTPPIARVITANGKARSNSQ